jgi:hypothetical protein
MTGDLSSGSGGSAERRLQPRPARVFALGPGGTRAAARLLVASLLVLASSRLLAGTVTFVQPLDGSQVVGPGWIEVRASAAGIDRVEFLVDGRLAGIARNAPWRIAYDFGATLTAHEIVAKVFSNGYRTVETAKVTTAALAAGETLNVDLVEVPMRIRAPRVVSGSDVSVRENGVEQTVRQIVPQRGAAHFVFVIDRSLSMGDGKLGAALRAVDAEVRNLRADDTVSVVLFNHNVARARRLQRGESLEALFGDVSPSGGTSLRDALASIASRERTYAIVITDGGDRNSETPEETALRRISGTRTVVDAIVLGEASRFLERAAKNTGGALLAARSGTIRRALHELILDINSRYLLVYQSRGTGSGWRTIRVTPRRSGITVMNARKGYYAE